LSWTALRRTVEELSVPAVYVKGMIQVLGTTYRIVRVAPASYQAVRVLDDEVVGGFCCRTALEVEPRAVDLPTMLLIARTAVRAAKISSTGNLPPP
jgi:hypothetical protein